MPLLKRREFVADSWIILDDDEATPEDGDIAVSFARLVSEFKTLMLHNGRLGAVFGNDQCAQDLAPYLQRLDLVILDFPAFTDGRAYSQARELRQYYSFRGELRASGNLLPDQLGFMQQVGFDAFAIENERFSLEDWTKAAASISLSYQRHLAGRGQTPILTARQADDRAEQPNFG